MYSNFITHEILYGYITYMEDSVRLVVMHEEQRKQFRFKNKIYLLEAKQKLHLYFGPQLEWEYESYFSPSGIPEHMQREAGLFMVRTNIRISVAATMYQSFEKDLRDRLYCRLFAYELDHDEFKNVFWSMSAPKLLRTCLLPQWGLDTPAYLDDIEQCHMLANTLKHGYGTSFKALFSAYPQYSSMTDHGKAKYVNDVDRVPTYFAHFLRFGIDDLERFSDAIDAFWASVPSSTPVEELLTRFRNLKLISNP